MTQSSDDPGGGQQSRDEVEMTAAAASTSANGNGVASEGGQGIIGKNDLHGNKKRRRMHDLEFSSPGPAFWQATASSDGGSDSDASSRAARRVVSRAVSNGNGSLHANQRHGSPLAASHSDGLTKVVPRSSSSIFRNFTPGKGKQKADDEPTAVQAASSSSPLSRHRRLEKVSSRLRDAPQSQHERRSSGSPSKGLLDRSKVPSSSSTSESAITNPRQQRLLDVAKTQLDGVYKNHDMLVRELFHLHKFVTLIGFDPEVALQDRSDVFERFRIDYDLASRLSGESGRATRRSLSSKRGDLAIIGQEKSSNMRSNGDGGGSSGKRHREEVIESVEIERPPVKRGRGRPRKESLPPLSTSRSSKSAIVELPKKRGRGRPSNAELAARARLAAEQERDEEDSEEDESEDDFSESSVAVQPIKRGRGRPPKNKPVPPQINETDYVPEPVEMEYIDGIPRLRVLKPANLPPPSQQSSLANFFHSFVYTGEIIGSTGEWETITNEEQQKREQQTAALYDRIDTMKSQGLLQNRQDAFKKSLQNRAKEPTRPIVAWDDILAQIAVSSSQQRSIHRARIGAAKRLAKMIQIYWDEKLGRGEKQRKAEERRVRALAKWTVREVRKQWKLAVNVIRADRQAREKKEKDRLGREQLKNILEQSSQMLGKQHKALLEGEQSDVSNDDEDDDDDEEEDEEEPSETESDIEIDDDSEESLSDDESEMDESEAESEASLESEEAGGLSQLLLPARESQSSAEENSIRFSPADDDEEFDHEKELIPRSITVNGVDESDERIEKTTSEAVDEDAELERKMWEEDESESDNSADLAEDAEMPIEELMKKYKYSEEVEVEAEADAGVESSEVDDVDEEMDESPASPPPPQQNGHLSASVTPSLRRSRSRANSASPPLEKVKVKPPFLLRGTLRPYQQIGFEWLVNLYNTGSNGILADEMGLGKTIQTISLLGHLACDKGNWGPHLVVAPTSVMLNWEVEFKKFLPGFKILSYYGSQRERKEKRKGWNTENSFNVCITSYQLILADQHILRRKPWQYLVLDEAHHIKNFRSQRWQTLLGFNSQRRLLLTGTPLQNNLMDLWSLMYFLMPNGVTNAEGVVNSGFASMKDFQQWFSNPLDRAVESAGLNANTEEMDNETRGMVSKLHTLLRPYLLRRLKSEVEREMPNKYEHVIKCRLSKRQQFLYNDFMSRAKTRESLASGNYLSIINCLMQLRKVCNHPDLFEQRPIVTSFAMDHSVVGGFAEREAIVRRHFGSFQERVNLDVINLRFSSDQHLTPIVSRSLKRLDASKKLPFYGMPLPQIPPLDTHSIAGYAATMKKRRESAVMSQWQHQAYLNQLRCQAESAHLCDQQSVALLQQFGPGTALYPQSVVVTQSDTFLHRSDSVHKAILGYNDRRESVQNFIDRFAFVTPRAVAMDMPQFAVPELTYDTAPKELLKPEFDTLHAPAVKLQIAFPDSSLLQYDCGKLQELAKLMDQCKYGTHRILIFTQMTKILDILEIWLSLNGFNYLRLDGSTKVEDRQALTEKFNRDDRIKAFILSTRSGGLGINLTGADMVLFWDLDWNFQIEAQCMDRAHRIGQTRDVHIYRFVSEHTIEENMLKKSNEKRLLDAMVIQDGQFTTEGLGKMSWIESMFDEGSRSIAGVQVGGGGGASNEVGMSDRRIENAMDQAEDEEDAQAAQTARQEIHVIDDDFANEMGQETAVVTGEEQAATAADEEEDGGTVDDYMLRQVDADWEYFSSI